METTNSKTLRGDLQLTKPWTVLRRTESMPEGNRGSTTHRSTHPQGEQKEKKNVLMAWINKKKSCDMILQNCMIACLKMYKIADEVIKFIKKTMKNWRVDLIAGGKI